MGAVLLTASLFLNVVAYIRIEAGDKALIAHKQLFTLQMALSKQNHDKLFGMYLQVETERDEAQEALMLLTKEYKLLTTFRDAGILPESVEEVYNLVQEFDKMPFGSPFKGGFRVTDSYGNGAPTWYRPSGVHKGLDMVPTTRDRTIYATADGEIIDFGWSDTIGKFIVFETASGYRLKYAHLRTIYYQDVDGAVKGIKIQKGSRLAFMGGSGTLATGDHLHLEIMIQNEEGEYVHLNPEEIASYVGAEED